MFSSAPDLTDLQRRLRRVEGLLELIADHLEISPDEIKNAGRGRASAEVAELAAQGKKIQAIKLLRELEGLDLAAAKQVVDEL